MQRLAQEQNEEIEKVNRERKYHQVIMKYLFTHFLHSSLLFVLRLNWNFGMGSYQQTTAYELNALSQEWRQLCVKNMEIQSACAVLETQIDSLKREASERWRKFCCYLFASLSVGIVSTKLKTLVVEFQGMELRRETWKCQTASIAVRQTAWAIHLSCLRYNFECLFFKYYL